MYMARSAKYKNVQSNPNVAFVADDVPAPEHGAAGVRFLEIRGAAETVTAPPGQQVSASAANGPAPYSRSASPLSSVTGR
jgi:hypothetical protein